MVVIMVNLDVTRSDTGVVSLTSGQVDRGVRILVKAPIWTLRNVAVRPEKTERDEHGTEEREKKRGRE